jgi:hypothetical protein
MISLRTGLYLILSLFGLQTSAFAGEPDYAVAKIPFELLKNANAVVRSEETKFEILSTNHTRLTRHYVVTVLNEKGNYWAQLSEVYNTHRDISAIEGALYDAAGRQLKKVRRKDIGDYSGVSANELMADDRIRYHNFSYRVYPYTVAYDVVIEHTSTLSFPAWVPQKGEGVSVEASRYTLVAQPGYEVRYKEFNCEAQPEISLDKNGRSMTWSLRNKPALDIEDFSTGWQDFATIVLFGPTKFQVDQYQGNMASWQEFGKFIHTLREGRDKLPSNVIQAVHTMTDKLNNPREKIIALYEYLQKQTRYISIQLGIGGWQPFPAEEVAAKGYGDCKALTNYMASLLQEAGIRSIYTLVRSGDDGQVVEDFPAQQFNHVILCVPVATDTIWLECTDQSAPAGYLGTFTSDRAVLLVDKDGGKLARTPAYVAKQNAQFRKLKATIDAEGTMQLSAFSTYAALRQEGFHYRIQQFSPQDMKAYLEHRFDFSDYTVNTFNYKEHPAAIPVVEENLEINANHYATVTGKRIFFVPNVMSRFSVQIPKDTKRMTDLNMGFGYNDVDSAVFTFSQPVDAESIPKDISIQTKFGTYATRYQFRENVLQYTRKLEFKGGRVDAGDCEQLVSFLREIYKADRSWVVLVTKESSHKGF